MLPNPTMGCAQLEFVLQLLLFQQVWDRFLAYLSLTHLYLLELHPSADCHAISVTLEAPPSIRGIDLFGPLTPPVSTD